MRSTFPANCAAFAAVSLSAGTAGATTPTVYDLGADPGMGFNLVSWANFGSNGPGIWADAVQQVYDAGFDEVSLSPVRFYNLGSGAIATTSSKGAELSHIAAGVTRAKQLGMQVTVNPFVEPENFSTWRGFWNPTPGSGASDTFWNDYRQYIADAAAMAQSTGADAFNVGTEMQSLTSNPGHNASWTSVIDAADAAFTGSLGYASNWGEYNNPNIDNAIWDHPAMDYMGIDAYFPIVTASQADNSGTNPNPAFIDLVETNWNNLLDGQILPYAAARQNSDGLPVVFTEYGLLPFNRATVQHGAVQNGVVDTDEQIMGFDGLLRALDGRQADGEVLAVHLWQWGMFGSNGSQWNLDPSPPADQPNNVAAAQWLVDFVSNPAVLLAGDYNGSGLVEQGDLDLVLANWGVDASDTTPSGWINDLPIGQIEQGELDRVLGGWGGAAAPSFAGSALPEPATAGVLLVSSFAALSRRSPRIINLASRPRDHAHIPNSRPFGRSRS